MTGNLKEVAQDISITLDDVAKVREYKELVENLYKENCVSACLDGIEGVDYETTNDVKTINILLDNNGEYTLADVNRQWGIPKMCFSEPHLFTNERGRRIQITNTELVNKDIISGFMKQAVIPELNAYRFAYIAGNMCHHNNGMTYEKLLKECDEKDIITFVSSECPSLTVPNKKIVPFKQFYNAIDLFDGVTNDRRDERKGGFAKHKANTLYEGDTDGKELQYIALNKNALFTVAKFDLKIVGDMLSFVVYHDVFVREEYKNFVCSEVVW